jgi:hypothetical protein
MGSGDAMNTKTFWEMKPKTFLFASVFAALLLGALFNPWASGQTTGHKNPFDASIERRTTHEQLGGFRSGGAPPPPAIVLS